MNYPVILKRLPACIAGVTAFTICAAQNKSTVTFTVSVKDTGAHYLHVECRYSKPPGDAVLFSMPAWMPGYYQLMDYDKAVENFSAAGSGGRALTWQKTAAGSWAVAVKNTGVINIAYDIKATRKFVAASYVDGERGYIAPAGVFMYPEGGLQQPVTVVLHPLPAWSRVATGLDSLGGTNRYTYTAPHFDILYDCPILMGNLEELPPFFVKGVPHRFIAFKPGVTNGVAFMADLQKIVQAAVQMMGDIPYKQYTFIGIGPGRGGIEHLNNTTISFDGRDLDNPAGRERMLAFIAHEYFHHYNVKRIRPVELGPFDYSRPNRSNQLWISEGLTVYYEYLLLRRAGLTTGQALLKQITNNLAAYEDNTGRLYQSLVQASYETWSDGPFGRPADSVRKTISYYDKGPVIGMLLDFAIRNASGNRRSLDDVMRLLYDRYYKQLGRGFTEAEFQQACETAAGASLKAVFEYVYTTREVNYNQYLAYAGLELTRTVQPNGKPAFYIQPLAVVNEQQRQIFSSWAGQLIK